MDEFISSVQVANEKYGRCVIAVSEGIHDQNGEAIVTKLAKDIEKDAHGNVQLYGVQPYSRCQNCNLFSSDQVIGN